MLLLLDLFGQLFYCAPFHDQGQVALFSQAVQDDFAKDLESRGMAGNIHSEIHVRGRLYFRLFFSYE